MKKILFKIFSSSLIFLILLSHNLYGQCVVGDCENGQGTFQYKSGTRYEGQFKDGKPFGLGTCYYSNGNKYIGEWNVFPKGKGTYFYPNGEQQNGIWDKDILIHDLQCIEGDCKNGRGLYTFPSGDQYEGDFRYGKPHGLGIKRFSDGSKFVGDFEKGLFSGYGTLSYPDGREITGFWKNNNLDIAQEDLPKTEDEEMFESEHFNSRSIMDSSESELPVNPSSIRVWAVIVGISDYKNLPRLNYSDDDAYQIYAFLKSPEGGALPDEQVRVLVDESATHDKILAALNETFGKAEAQDVIFLYFSGHGTKGSFLPIDFVNNKNKLFHKEILEVLDHSSAKSKIVIADACHSGSFSQSRSNRSIALTIRSFYEAFEATYGGTALLLSSKSEEISLESNGLRQGVFSHFFIRGLKGEADRDSNLVITVSELFNYLSAKVEDYTAQYQTPVLSGEFDENMPVGVIRRRVKQED